MKVNQSEEGFEQFFDTFVNTLKSDVEGELGFVKNNEEFNIGRKFKNNVIQKYKEHFLR